MHTNIPPISCYIRNEYLYDFEKDGLTEALVFSVKAIKNHALFFQAMTDCGAVFDKLPISALTTNKDALHQPFHHLQLWDCPSYSVECIQFSYLQNKKAKTILKDKNFYIGKYCFTLDYHSDQNLDDGFSENWPEHKSMHILELDNGNFCAQPNNRILFHDPAWIEEPFKTVPKYKVCSKFYRCEQNEKWSTTGDDYFYEVKSEEDDKTEIVINETQRT